VKAADFEFDNGTVFTAVHKRMWENQADDGFCRANELLEAHRDIEDDHDDDETLLGATLAVARIIQNCYACV
jgi:hypothetical protein